MNTKALEHSEPAQAGVLLVSLGTPDGPIATAILRQFSSQENKI